MMDVFQVGDAYAIVKNGFSQISSERILVV